MNEAETRAEYIDPLLRAAGWGVSAMEVQPPEIVVASGELGKHPEHTFLDESHRPPFVFLNEQFLLTPGHAQHTHDEMPVDEHFQHFIEDFPFDFQVNGRLLFQCLGVEEVLQALV